MFLYKKRCFTSSETAFYHEKDVTSARFSLVRIISFRSRLDPAIFTHLPFQLNNGKYVGTRLVRPQSDHARFDTGKVGQRAKINHVSERNLGGSKVKNERKGEDGRAHDL